MSLIDSMPYVHGSFRAGALSYSKVRALSRVATSENEAYLCYLARYATGAQMERIVGAYRGAKEAMDPELERARHARRRLDYFYDADGSLCGYFRLPPDQAAVFLSAIEAAEKLLEDDEDTVETTIASTGGVAVPVISAIPTALTANTAAANRVAAQPHFPDTTDAHDTCCPIEYGGNLHSGSEPDPLHEDSLDISGEDVQYNGYIYKDDSAETSFGLSQQSDSHPSGISQEPGSPIEEDPPSAKRADALEMIARLSLEHANCIPDSHDAFLRSASSPRPLVVMHLESTTPSSADAPSLKPPGIRDTHDKQMAITASVGAPGAIDPLLIIPSDTTRRLGCDSSIKEQFETHGIVLDAGRTRRLVSTAQRRALLSRDGGCRFPGCHRRRFTDAHHIHHWMDGGNTDLDNLVTLCRFHHHLVHEGGFKLQKAPGNTFTVLNPEGMPIGSTCVELSGSPEPVVRSDPGFVSKSDYIGLNHICEPMGAGERYDLGITIDALLWADGSMQVEQNARA